MQTPFRATGEDVFALLDRTAPAVLHYRDLFPPPYRLMHAEVPSLMVYIEYGEELGGRTVEMGGWYDIRITLHQSGEYDKRDLVFVLSHEVAHAICAPIEDPEQRLPNGVKVDWRATAESYANAVAEAVTYLYYVTVDKGGV